MYGLTILLSEGLPQKKRFSGVVVAEAWEAQLNILSLDIFVYIFFVYACLVSLASA